MQRTIQHLLITLTLACVLTSNLNSAPPATPQNVRPAWLWTPYFYEEAFTMWEPVPGAEVYRVYRSHDGDMGWTLVGTNITVPFFADPFYSTLPSYYSVTAVNSDGESSGSEPVTVTEQVYEGSILPPDISQWNGTLTATSAVVQWASSYIAGVESILEWGPSLNGETNYVFHVMDTNYIPWHGAVLENLTPLTTYHYRITAIYTNRGGVQYISSFTTPDTNHPPTLHAEVYGDFSGWAIVYWATDPELNSPMPQQITYQVLTQPTNGSLRGPFSGWRIDIGLYEQFQYDPNPGARGQDSFTLVASDGFEFSAPLQVQLTNWWNTVPQPGYLQVDALEDTPVVLPLNAVDAEGDTVTFRITDTWGGTVLDTGTNYIFTPEPNLNGYASVYYEVTDGYGTNFGSIDLAIAPVNDKPVIRVDQMPPNSTWEDQSLAINLWIEDLDGFYEGGIVEVIAPLHGTIAGPGWFVIYTPESNYFGTDAFTFSVRDVDGTTSDPVTLTVEVLPLNDPPVVYGQNVIALEDTPLVFSPTGWDVEGQSLTFQVVGFPAHGEAWAEGTNVIYYPFTDYIGADDFVIVAVDSDGFWSEYAWIQVQVLPANDPPQAADASYSLHSDVVAWRALPVSDLEDADLTCVLVEPPTNGTVVISGTNFLYTPVPGVSNYFDQFTYRAGDGLSLGNTATITLWIGTTNFVPVAYDQAITLTAGTAVFLQLQIGDADYDEPAIVLMDTAPAHGSLELNGTGGVLYTPEQGYTGTDFFTYRPYDGFSTGNLATVAITVTPPNRPPVAVNTVVPVVEDGSATFTLAASDPDGDSLVFTVTDGPTNGVLLGAAPSLQYSPAPNSSGTDRITFRVSDGVYAASGTVTFTITALNDAPIATNAVVVAYEDYPITFALGGSDIDNAPSALTFTIVTPPQHGTLSSGNQVRTYLPASNFNGSDSFTFSVTDGAAESSVATVTISVLPLNDPPQPIWQAVTNNEDTSIAIMLLAADIDGDALTYGVALAPHDGALSGDAPNLVYTPNANFHGGESFLFWVSDGSVSVTQGVAIVVLPVNDVPEAAGVTVAAEEDTPVNIQLAASDVDGDAVTYTLVAAPEHGTISGTGANVIYTPAANYNGSDSFSFKANDGTADGNEAVVSITVSSINDVPTADAQSTTAPYNGSKNIVLSGSDAEGSPLTYTIVSGPAHGVLSGAAPNLTYTPAIGYSGPDSFTFTVNDGQFNSAVALVSITVATPMSTPAAPAALTAVASSTVSGTINLSWNDNAANEDGFKVERSTDNRNWTQIAVIGPDASTYTDSGLARNKTFHYRVRAYNQLGNSSYSNTASAKAK